MAGKSDRCSRGGQRAGVARATDAGRGPGSPVSWPTVGLVRIGLVAPYSLTIPGGVQGQVMGLARALRSQGHEVRVLAPCDGAPPDGGVARRLSLRCAVSEDARATAEAALGGEYELVFNGIEVDRFAKASPWPSEGPTIFFIGRHEPRKGLATLLGALSGLPSSVRLWVAGDGPQTAALKAATASDPRVEWLGRVDDEEAASRLRGADVFCAPSVHGESFGVVLLEAMAAHTAIV